MNRFLSEFLWKWVPLWYHSQSNLIVTLKVSSVMIFFHFGNVSATGNRAGRFESDEVIALMLGAVPLRRFENHCAVVLERGAVANVAAFFEDVQIVAV